MRGARVAFAIVFLAPSVGLAQPTEQDKALALTLFKRGRELMEANELDTACRSFAESQRLDPGGGTLLNLAVCHEQQGRTATAWAEYSDALALARRDRRADRIELAESRMGVLEKKLSRLVIVPPDGEAARGLRITRDGADVPRAAWRIAIPVDPGAHVIDAFSGSANVFHADVAIGDADTKTVDVVPAAVPPPEERPPAGGVDARSVLAWSLVGAGTLSIGAGSWFGVRAIDLRSASDDACRGDRCPTSAIEDNDSAKSFADASTVTIAVGVAAVVAGVVLLVATPSHVTAARRSR